MRRVSASYEHIDPALVGNERRILISELAGQSNILVKTAKYATDNNKELGVKLREMVQDLENQGYEFEAAEASFDLLVRKALGVYRPKFERLAYHVKVQTSTRRRANNRSDRQGAHWRQRSPGGR